MMAIVSQRTRTILLGATLPLLLLAIYMAFVYAPSPSEGFAAPNAQRIFYFHVASAWVSYVAFFVTSGCCIAYLKTRSQIFDCVAVSSAEVGVVFCTVAIVTGSIWARAEWGVFWRWEDMKLFMTLVLWLIYLSYLSIRGMVIVRETRARVSSVFGILGILSIPLSFSANRIWAQFHPTVIATSQGSLQSGMLQALIVAVMAMTMFYICLLLERIDIEMLQLKLEDFKDDMGDDTDE
jgi:heme exporter protein C